MRYCLMNSFFLYWNQERRFPMNKKYLLQIIIIASLVFGGFALLGTGENRQKVSSENRHFQSIKNSQS